MGDPAASKGWIALQAERRSVCDGFAAPLHGSRPERRNVASELDGKEGCAGCTTDRLDWGLGNAYLARRERSWSVNGPAPGQAGRHARWLQPSPYTADGGTDNSTRQEQYGFPSLVVVPNSTGSESATATAGATDDLTCMPPTFQPQLIPYGMASAGPIIRKNRSNHDSVADIS